MGYLDDDEFKESGRFFHRRRTMNDDPFGTSPQPEIKEGQDHDLAPSDDTQAPIVASPPVSQTEKNNSACEGSPQGNETGSGNSGVSMSGKTTPRGNDVPPITDRMTNHRNDEDARGTAFGGLE